MPDEENVEQESPQEEQEENFDTLEMDEVLAKLDNYIYSKPQDEESEDSDDLSNYLPYVEKEERKLDKDIAEIAKVARKTASKVRDLEGEQRAREMYDSFFSAAKDDEITQRLGRKILKAKDDPRTMRDKINMVRAEAEALKAEYEAIRAKAMEDAEREANETLAGRPIPPTPVRSVPQEIEDKRKRYIESGDEHALVDVAEHLLYGEQ